VWEEVLPVLLRSLGQKGQHLILVEQGATRPGNIFYKWRFTNVPKRCTPTPLVKCKPRLSTGGEVEEISGEKLLQQNGLFLRRGYYETVEGSVLGAKQVMEELNPHTFTRYRR
jgi:hypothetical protein